MEGRKCVGTSCYAVRIALPPTLLGGVSNSTTVLASSLMAGRRYLRKAKRGREEGTNEGWIFLTVLRDTVNHCGGALWWFERKCQADRELHS